MSFHDSAKSASRRGNVIQMLLNVRLRKCPISKATANLNFAASACASWPHRTAACRRACRGSAFTLIELVAVITLLAVLAATTLVTVQDPLQQAQLKRAVSGIASVDRRVRAAAGGHQGGELRIDLDRGQIYPVWASRRGPRLHYQLPRSVQIDRARTRRQRADSGRLRLAVTASGLTDMYAVRLSTSRGHQAWLLVLGTTGQTLILENDSDVERYFALARSPTGNDTR